MTAKNPHEPFQASGGASDPRSSTAPEQEVARRDRRRRAARVRRVLAGSGVLDLVAYDIAPERAHRAIAHTTTACGAILVALDVSADADGFYDPQAFLLRVRVDLAKEAPEWQASILAYTVHALGTLSWAEDEQVAQCVRDGHIDEGFAYAASIPGVRVGALDLTQIIVHDADGAVEVPPWDALGGVMLGARSGASEYPRLCDTPAEELAACEVVRRVCGGELSRLFACPTARLLAARSGPASAGSGPASAGAEDATYCVDIDASGITLMHVTAAGSRVSAIPFAREADSLEALERELLALL